MQRSFYGLKTFFARVNFMTQRDLWKKRCSRIAAAATLSNSAFSEKRNDFLFSRLNWGGYKKGKVALLCQEWAWQYFCCRVGGGKKQQPSKKHMSGLVEETGTRPYQGLLILFQITQFLKYVCEKDFLRKTNSQNKLLTKKMWLSGVTPSSSRFQNFGLSQKCH